MASNTCKKRALQTESDDDLEQTPNFVFKGNETFARFLVIKSMEEKAVTSLSPFIIEKQIESIIGSPKSVKKLKNKTLLVEANRKSQTENLLKTTTFFGLRVSVTEHQSLNSSKGIICDRMLKGEKEDEIVDYLKEQGVTACKRFKIKKDHEMVETNTLLLTFNTVNVPKSLRIFYRIVPVDIYVPNPLRCFNCQRFGHHENNCPVDLGSVCANCGAGGHDHHTSACKNAPKCVNCGKDQVSRSSNCEIWKKEKEICKIKVTKNITYLEAKKQFESQTSDLDFTKIVQSLSSKPESKTVGTQFFENDFTIHPSSKVITPSVKPKSQPKPNSSSQSQPSSQSQSNSRSRSGSSRPQSGSQSSSKSSSQSHTQSGSQSSSQSNSKSSSQKNNPRSSSGRNSGRGSNSGGGSSSDKQGKGSNDPIKMVNKYGILDDDMETT